MGGWVGGREREPFRPDHSLFSLLLLFLPYPHTLVQEPTSAASSTLRPCGRLCPRAPSWTSSTRIGWTRRSAWASWTRSLILLVRVVLCVLLLPLVVSLPTSGFPSLSLLLTHPPTYPYHTGLNNDVKESKAERQRRLECAFALAQVASGGRRGSELLRNKALAIDKESLVSVDDAFSPSWPVTCGSSCGRRRERVGTPCPMG